MGICVGSGRLGTPPVLKPGSLARSQSPCPVTPRNGGRCMLDAAVAGPAGCEPWSCCCTCGRGGYGACDLHASREPTGPHCEEQHSPCTAVCHTTGKHTGRRTGQMGLGLHFTGHVRSGCRPRTARGATRHIPSGFTPSPSAHRNEQWSRADTQCLDTRPSRHQVRSGTYPKTHGPGFGLAEAPGPAHRSQTVRTARQVVAQCYKGT